MMQLLVALVNNSGITSLSVIFIKINRTSQTFVRLKQPTDVNHCRQHTL